MLREDSYQHLIAWQKAMDLVDGVYDATDRWPRHEHFGIVGQVRRAAVSIPANIAEGHGRTGRREFLHHLSIAHGSLCEVETLLQIAHRRQFIDGDSLRGLTLLMTDVRRLLKGLIRSLQEPTNSSPLTPNP